MTTLVNFPNELTSSLLEFLKKKMGIHIQINDRERLIKKLEPIKEEFGFDNLPDCIEWLLSKEISQEEIITLARYLTVGETYFFRDDNSFNTLQTKILPDIIKKKAATDRHIRIWSAGCCTGEEPYSIAILLSQMIPDLENWNISILATDINTTFLKKAQEGLYKEWSFRLVPKILKQCYFKKMDNRKYMLLSSIKKMVRFNYLNLAEDSYPSLLNGTNGMDLILCKNVLIYFSNEVINSVIHKFGNSLVEDGWLVVAAVEVPFVNDQYLKLVDFAGTTFFQKTLSSNTIPKIPIIKKQPPPPVLFKFKAKEKPIEKKKEEPAPTLEGLYNKGHYQEVINRLEKAPKKNFALLSRCYANIGSLELSLQWCLKGLEKDSIDPELHLIHATVLQETGDVEEAIKALKKTLYLSPNFIMAHFFLGSLYRQKKLKIDSERHFRNALKLLKEISEEEVIPFSEGMNSEKMREVISEMQRSRLWIET